MKKYTIAEVDSIVRGSKKGTIHTVITEKKLKLRAGIDPSTKIVKRSKYQVRFGLEYHALAEVKQNFIDKFGCKPSDVKNYVGSRKWGTWKQYPYYLTHNGSDYVHSVTANGNTPTTTYYLNGVEVSKDVVLKYCPKSELSSSGTTTQIDFKLDNLVYIK